MPLSLLLSVVRYLTLIWSLLFDSRVPGWAKALPAAAALYALFPADLVRDILPVVGITDDLIVAVVLFWLFVLIARDDAIADGEMARRKRNEAGPVIDGRYRVIGD